MVLPSKESSHKPITIVFQHTFYNRFSKLLNTHVYYITFTIIEQLNTVFKFITKWTIFSCLIIPNTDTFIIRQQMIEKFIVKFQYSITHLIFSAYKHFPIIYNVKKD